MAQVVECLLSKYEFKPKYHQKRKEKTPVYSFYKDILILTRILT
jgi:hypothetical protein